LESFVNPDSNVVDRPCNNIHFCFWFRCFNEHGLDSVATISEQSKAEAKEAESEGSNKDAEK
jgi:hypothetical protein